jgi:hypothetical protein
MNRFTLRLKFEERIDPNAYGSIRTTTGAILEDVDGEWVRWSDYASGEGRRSRTVQPLVGSLDGDK